MKKKDVIESIYGGLATGLSPKGFKLKKSDEAFFRRLNGCEQSIAIGVVDLTPQFLITVTIGIRLDAVESLFHEFSGAPPQYQSMSTTTLTKLEYFLGEERKEYVVSTPDEVSAVVSGISEALLSIVLPFLDKCTDISSLEAMVRTNQAFDITRQPSGLMHFLILSRLAGRRDFAAPELRGRVANLSPLDRLKIEKLIERNGALSE